MKIFIIGNINSGKTYYSKKIRKIFKDYEYISIDDYRKKYGDFTIKGEEKSKEEFIKKINSLEKCIVEFSGLGEMVEKINKDNYIVLYINTKIDVCLERINKEKFSKIPYPKNWNQPIEQTIKDLDFLIQSEAYNKLWFMDSINYFEFCSDEEFDKIPLNYYFVLSNLLETISLMNLTCISFGGLANKTVGNKSDIDLFLICDDYKKVKTSFEINYPNIKISNYKNKLYFTFNKIPVEIICIKNISEIQFLYSHSKIDNVKPTILCGKCDEKFIKELNTFNGECELRETIEYLKYTFFLLETMDKENDLKFWLNTTIVSFCMYKLKYYLINNDFKDFFLPNKSSKFFTRTEQKIIFYRYGENKTKYLKSIKPIINRLLKSYNYI